MTRLGSRIQDGKRGGGQRCRELQQQRQGGNLRIGHASQLAASSHGIPTQISGLLKTRLNQPRSTITVPSTDSTMLAFMIFIASFDDCFTWNLRRGWKAYLALWHFRGFDLRDFWFNAGYNSFLFPSPLVLRSNLDLRSFCSCIIFATLTALLIFFSKFCKFKTERIHKKKWYWNQKIWYCVTVQQGWQLTES